MTTGRFQVVGASLVGRGLAFDIGALGLSGDAAATIVELVEVVYRQGRESAILPYDDRFDLSCAVEALRALAVIVGPSATSERYRRAADIVARQLQQQERGG